jgi:hypothetical protein
MTDTTGWQPIETAPRDGTKFLCWVPRGPYEGISINRWKEGYWWCTSRANPPTHWMPLPEPPSPRAKAKSDEKIGAPNTFMRAFDSR